MRDPDNGGKSTICKLLTEQYDVNFDKFIRHHSPWEMLARVTDALAYPTKRGWDKGGVTVLDRWHYPSDVTNEPIYTGNKSVLEPLGDTIECRLKELDTHLIYVTAPIEVLRERYEARGDEFVDFDQIQKVDRLYQEFMYFRTTLPVTRVSTESLTAQEIVEQIASKFNLRRKIK